MPCHRPCHVIAKPCQACAHYPFCVPVCVPVYQGLGNELILYQCTSPTTESSIRTTSNAGWSGTTMNKRPSVSFGDANEAEVSATLPVVGDFVARASSSTHCSRSTVPSDRASVQLAARVSSPGGRAPRSARRPSGLHVINIADDAPQRLSRNTAEINVDMSEGLIASSRVCEDGLQ